MKRRIRHACVLWGIWLVALSAIAQNVPGAAQSDPYNDPQRTGASGVYSSQGAIIIITVYGENRRLLDRQAVVKLAHKTNKTTLWQTTTLDRSEAGFGDLLVGPYEIEVSAVGYLTERKDFVVGGAYITYRVDMTLKKDPASIDLSAREAKELPPKPRKELQRGTLALKSGNLREARKRLDNAYRMVPSSPDVNFLLGYLFYQQKELSEAEKYLSAAAKLDSRNVQALTLLGRLYMNQGHYEKAKPTLAQATAADPEYWMAHSLLADACLKLNDFDGAREHAQLAIEKGKGFGNAAQLALGQALARLGKLPEAIQALQTFLKDEPKNPLAPQVRELIADLQQRQDNPTTAVAQSAPARTEPLLSATEPAVGIKSWQPAGIDDARPSVAAGVTCPADKIILSASARVKQLVDDLARFDAIEDVLHQDVDEFGNPVSHETRSYNYIAAITETWPGVLQVDEYRSGRSDVIDFPRQIATRGLPALALVFHPSIRDDFQLECEGLGQWQNQATWLVHFRQRDDHPNRIHGYNIGGNVHPVNLKGRAWVSAKTFAIVRIEAELVSPMPQIQLLSEHWAVDYGPVVFEKKKVELWLPKSAELFFDFRRHRYFRRHSFDHFMLFSVDSEEKRKVPTAEPQPQSAPAPSK